VSFKAVQWVYKVRGLTLIERIVLSYLAFRQNSETGKCTVSVKSIRDHCEMGKSTIFKALQGLKVKGFIKSTRRTHKSWQLASKYTLDLDRYSPIETTPSTIETTQSTMWMPLESGSESGSESESEKTACDQTVDAIISAGNEIFDMSKINKIKLFNSEQEVKFDYGPITGLPLTPEMKALGITGVAFESTEELEKYGPQLGVPVKTEDVLQLHQKKLTPEEAIHKAKKGKESYTTSGLKGLWRDLQNYYYPGVFQCHLTFKDQGKLGLLRKTLPKVDIGEVMWAVLRDWVGFGKFLKDQGLVLDYPDTPHVGFFLKHSGMMVEFSKKLSTPSTSGGPKPYVMGE
jgi:hypothetical protein